MLEYNAKTVYKSELSQVVTVMAQVVSQWFQTTVIDREPNCPTSTRQGDMSIESDRSPDEALDNPFLEDLKSFWANPEHPWVE